MVESTPNINNAKTNALGLTPEQSKVGHKPQTIKLELTSRQNLATRQPNAEEKAIMEKFRTLYSSSQSTLSEETYSM